MKGSLSSSWCSSVFRGPFTLSLSSSSSSIHSFTYPCRSLFFSLSLPIFSLSSPGLFAIFGRGIETGRERCSPGEAIISSLSLPSSLAAAGFCCYSHVFVSVRRLLSIPPPHSSPFRRIFSSRSLSFTSSATPSAIDFPPSLSPPPALSPSSAPSSSSYLHSPREAARGGKRRGRARERRGRRSRLFFFSFSPFCQKANASARALSLSFLLLFLVLCVLALLCLHGLQKVLGEDVF